MRYFQLSGWHLHIFSVEAYNIYKKPATMLIRIIYYGDITSALKVIVSVIRRNYFRKLPAVF